MALPLRHIYCADLFMETANQRIPHYLANRKYHQHSASAWTLAEALLLSAAGLLAAVC